jgi:hypothetical protein
MSNIKSQIESWVATEAQATINNYYTASLPSLTVPTLTVKFGQKYAQVWNGTTIWAFIALTDEVAKAQVVGDLLKPASWRAPAKKSRGNILAGNAAYGPYGPAYL